MEVIAAEQCHVPRLLVSLKPPREGPGKKWRNRRTILDQIEAEDTMRYRLDKLVAIQMIEDDAPLPDDVARNVQWPHQGAIYVEYDRPIFLNPETDQDEEIGFLNGLVIVTENNSSAIIMLGSYGPELLYRKHRLDHATATVALDGKTRKGSTEAKDDEAARAARYYVRLATYLNANISTGDCHRQK